MAAARDSIPVTLDGLTQAVRQAWSRETSADPKGWSPQNPAWGQCAVTALVIQDYFGGTLLRGEVGQISHYWNVLPSGKELDLTRSQFGVDASVACVEPRTRDYVTSYAETETRYQRLARATSGYLSARRLSCA